MPHRPPYRPTARASAKLRLGLLAWIFAGGSLGTAGRAALEEALPTAPGAFPWTTGAINLVGAFALGLLLGVVRPMARRRGNTSRPAAKPAVRAEDPARGDEPTQAAASAAMAGQTQAAASAVTNWAEPARLGLGTGLLGGFTTYSTFAVETVRLAQGGHWWLGIGYAVGSVVLGVALAALALTWGRAAP